MSASKVSLIEKQDLLEWGNPFLYKGLWLAGWVFGLMQIVFYFLLTALGMEDSILLRGASAILLVLASLFDFREKEPKLFHRIYIEVAGFVSLPLVLAYSTYTNSESAYWYGSSIFFGLLYGFFCYPPVTFVFSTLLLTMGAFLPDNGHINSYLLAQVAGMVSLSLGIIVQMMLRHAHKVSLETQIKGEQLRIMHQHIDELEAREKVISSYVQPSLLTEMAAGYDPSRFKPEEASRAVLFIDMIGYSKMTAKNKNHEDLKKCLNLLNKYLGEIINSTMANGGTVDKIMGDAAMCVFPSGDQCMAAFISIQEGIELLNQGQIRRGEDPVYFGAGMSFGDVLIANFGNYRKLDRSIIGDEVDVAARLESLTRDYGVDALVSHDFLEAQSHSVHDARVIDCVKLKGKIQRIYVYEVFVHNSVELKSWKHKSKDKLKLAIDHKNKAEYQQAIDIIEQLIASCPTDQDEACIDQSLVLLRDKIEYEAELNFGSWQVDRDLGLVG